MAVLCSWANNYKLMPVCRDRRAVWRLLSAAVHGCESLLSAFSSTDTSAYVRQYLKDIRWKKMVIW